MIKVIGDFSAQSDTYFIVVSGLSYATNKLH